MTGLLRKYTRSTAPGTAAHARCMQRMSHSAGVQVRPRIERELWACRQPATYCLHCRRFLVPERNPIRRQRGDRPGGCVGYPPDPDWPSCLLGFLPAGPALLAEEPARTAG